MPGAAGGSTNQVLEALRLHPQLTAKIQATIHRTDTTDAQKVRLALYGFPSSFGRRLIWLFWSCLLEAREAKIPMVTKERCCVR